MALRLLFLGKLADLAGSVERNVAAPGPLGWDGLLAVLDPQLAFELACDRVKVALNGAVVADKAGLVARDGDELAFLPPVSGG